MNSRVSRSPGNELCCISSSHSFPLHPFKKDSFSISSPLFSNFVTSRRRRMGCIHCSNFQPCEQEIEQEPEQGKIYSWSNRERICDETEYFIQNLKDETVYRSPTESDQIFPLMVANCTRCVIGCFNAHSTVTISNCNKCIIYIGPSSDSVNVHGCTDCDMICAAMQFRTRDCQNMFISLFCTTQPSIESSSGLQFCPFNFFYSELEEQLNKAKLSIFNNKWYQVFDFNAGETDEKNWRLILGNVSDHSRVINTRLIRSEQKQNFEDMMKTRFACLTSFPGFENSVMNGSGHLFQVPVIEGRLRSSKHDHCLALFFLPPKGDGNQTDQNHDQEREWKKVFEFISELKKREETYLINTKQIPREDLKGVNLGSIEKPCNWEVLLAIKIGSCRKVQNEIGCILQTLSLQTIAHITQSMETTRQLEKVIFS